MSNIEARLIHVGAHEFEFVPPDKLRFTLRGALADDDAATYLDFIYAHAAKGMGRLYVSYDLAEMTRIDGQARQRVAKVLRPYPFAGIAIVGASFSTRMLVGMIIRAAKIIKPEFVDFPHKFMGSMAEADTWFDELRNKKA